MISITSGFGFQPSTGAADGNEADLYQADDTYLTATNARCDNPALDLCCNATDVQHDHSGE
ncbi:hypothetical protein HGP16_00090 [Rhizobium sp. P40RR-XXII]|uniref:hypothetical protein n=1 Tax=unclassified Rhizobium TaxID=2613769 RepID=UPI0014577970|nr:MULTISPECIES: hypothetical protein [unclassified Rhizobium]NLR84400.1 hypothetical protein [Rhizobium sp. P28RR-XV]NLS14954.1 hypothetical protein [Rhizobium sp. P40RR-XXII]